MKKTTTKIKVKDEVVINNNCSFHPIVGHKGVVKKINKKIKWGVVVKLNQPTRQSVCVALNEITLFRNGLQKAIKRINKHAKRRNKNKRPKG